MFKQKRMIFFYTETPLHVGAGRASANVDLPIQRERVTQYPMLQASGLKGVLRTDYRERNNLKDDDKEVEMIFGKAGEGGESFAGAISVGDGRLLLLPVRSLKGVFAWTTSVHALETFRRAASLTGQEIQWDVPEPTDNNSALVGDASDIVLDNKVILEEFSFNTKVISQVKAIGDWLAKHALPAGHQYWRNALPKRLCILPEDAFRDFCLYGTEVQTHIRIDPGKKTVQTGALWTTESLPVDCLLYAPMFAMDVRNGKDNITAQEVLGKFNALHQSYLQLGGDETTGQGWVSVCLYPKGE